MIVCPNCSHHNPEGATQCEACYTPLPEMMPCPNCGAQVQVDANFCGQCGFSIQVEEAILPTALETPAGSDSILGLEVPGLEGSKSTLPNVEAAASSEDPAAESATELSSPSIMNNSESLASAQAVSSQPQSLESVGPEGQTPEAMSVIPRSASATQLQSNRAALLHVRTNVEMTLPENLPVVHIGKPNDRIPPDIDVSGFPDSEVVSRVHADIRVEGDAYYIEDLGSSNGTYINNLPLVPGNRHRLRMGDRIALGKGDLVTFLFQVA